MRFKCAAPLISATGFMRFLFASLTKEANIIIDESQIVEKILDFMKKSKPEQEFLFEDIEIRENIDSIVSRDINEGINTLQTFGVIGKFNPSYEKIIIYLSEEEADEILEDCPSEDIKNAFRNLAKSFSGD